MARQSNVRADIPNPKPLRGKTILVTRPKDQAEEFSRLLQDRGARVVFSPGIRIVPPSSWKECDAAIEIINTYDSFIFTSANAVLGFFQRLDEKKSKSVHSSLHSVECFAVGDSTRAALLEEGMTPTRFSDVSNGRELADALLARPLHGKKLLFPKGNLAGEELPGALKSGGADIDEIIVYETVAPSGDDARIMRESFEKDSIDVVTFFSASSVRHLAAMVTGTMLSSKTIAVIGSSTATAAKELGLRTEIVAPKPTAVELANAIAHYCSTNQGHS